MKIAFLIADFERKFTGSISTAVYNITSSLEKEGIYFKVFSISKIYKNRVRSLIYPRLFPRTLWFNLFNLTKIRKELVDYDLIHVNFTLFPLKQLVKTKAKWVFSIHSSPLSELRVFLSGRDCLKYKKELIYRLAEFPTYYFLNFIDVHSSDVVLVPNKFIKNEIINHFFLKKEKIKVLSNFLIKSGNDRSKKSHEHIGKVRLLFFGRLVYRKGLIDLIMAASFIKKWNIDFILNIYGEGPLKGVIQKLIKDKDIGDVVKVRGGIAHEKVNDIIDEADIVVLPSFYEGQPFSFLETMARKKPIICYDAPFAKGLISNKTSLVIKKRDSLSLAKGIVSLIKNEKMRRKLGNNAYKHLLKNFNSEKTKSKYLEFYRSLI